MVTPILLCKCFLVYALRVCFLWKLLMGFLIFFCQTYTYDRRDLFGGEDVEVVPAKILPHHVRASRVGSIEIQVRLGSVTIKCHGSFDIYPSGRCDCEPLIQLHTTTSETIYLRELRSCDSASDDSKLCLEDDGSRSSDGMENLVLQERQTNRTGRRVLSIRPALYEKVQVWNTPS